MHNYDLFLGSFYLISYTLNFMASGISKMFLMTISLCQFYEANQGVIKGTHTMQQLVLFAVHLHLLFSIGLFLRSYIYSKIYGLLHNCRSTNIYI